MIAVSHCSSINCCGAQLVATSHRDRLLDIDELLGASTGCTPEKKKIMTQIRRNKIESPSKRKLEIPRGQLSPAGNTAKPGCRS